VPVTRAHPEWPTIHGILAGARAGGTLIWGARKRCKRWLAAFSVSIVRFGGRLPGPAGLQAGTGAMRGNSSQNQANEKSIVTIG